MTRWHKCDFKKQINEELLVPRSIAQAMPLAI